MLLRVGYIPFYILCISLILKDDNSKHFIICAYSIHQLFLFLLPFYISYHRFWRLCYNYIISSAFFRPENPPISLVSLFQVHDLFVFLT